MQEVQAVRGRALATQDDGHGRCALAIEGRRAGNGRVRAVGGDEVDQGRLMLEAAHEIHPAAVGLQLAVPGRREEFPAGGVQRRDAGITATGDVDGGQVQRQPQQVVAQRLGDELVDLVALLAGRATHDGAGGRVGVCTAFGERQRVEEGGDQTDFAVDEVRVEAVDGLGQHRVAEAIHHMGEFGDDRRVDGGVEAGGDEELIDVRLDLAGELLEHQVLVLHFGAELGGLEQPFPVPDEGRGIGRNGSNRSQQPLVEEVHITGGQNHFLGVLHQTVVLGVEHVVHGGEADVLVDPAVASDVVGFQQFVVVGGGVAVVGSGNCVTVSCQQRAGLAIERIGAVGDVIEEGMAGAHGARQADGCGWIALHQEVVGGAGQAVRSEHHHLRVAIGPLDEVAVGVGGQQRNVAHVRVGQVDAQHVAGLCLDHRPGGHAAKVYVIAVAKDPIHKVTIGDQPAGRCRAIGGRDIFAQEDLVRGVRAVGLVLVDEGRGGIGVLVNIVFRAQDAIRPGLVGGPGQDQEIGRAGRVVQRIIRHQRNENGTAVTFGDQVQTVVEELAEEGEPGVERRGKSLIRRGVGDEEDLPVIRRVKDAVEARAKDRSSTAIGVHRRRVIGGLVDDQIADDPRIGIGYVARSAIVGIGQHAARSWAIDVDAVAVLIIAEHRIEQAREQVVRRTELGLPQLQMVERTIYGPQSPGHLRVGQQIRQILACRMGFRDENLLKNEFEVRQDEVGHL
ncbi:hypothetical protein D9M72_317150 [compost metagenome]